MPSRRLLIVIDHLKEAFGGADPWGYKESETDEGEPQTWREMGNEGPLIY